MVLPTIISFDTGPGGKDRFAPGRRGVDKAAPACLLCGAKFTLAAPSRPRAPVTFETLSGWMP